MLSTKKSCNLALKRNNKDTSHLHKKSLVKSNLKISNNKKKLK